jgi:hypothetical protein
MNKSHIMYIPTFSYCVLSNSNDYHFLPAEAGFMVECLCICLSYDVWLHDSKSKQIHNRYSIIYL